MDEEVQDTKIPKYGVLGSVVHLGKSIHVGHFVAYAKQGKDWIYFNDRKVAKTEDPKIGCSYIFVLEKK